jgi:hypothetical protein
MRPITVCAADVDTTPPKFPRAVLFRGEWYLEAREGVDYRIPTDPTKCLGLVEHLAGKTWADRRFLFHAVREIARARDFHIHPFN